MIILTEEQITKLSNELDSEGFVSIEVDGYVLKVWETDQGEDNVRGEDYMNYMVSIYDAEELARDEDAEEEDGGLCTGYPRDAIEFLIFTESDDIKLSNEDTVAESDDVDTHSQPKRNRR